MCGLTRRAFATSASTSKSRCGSRSVFETSMSEAAANMFGYFSGTTVGCGHDEVNTTQQVPCPVKGETALRILDVPTDEETWVWNIVVLATWPLVLRIIGTISLRRHITKRRPQIEDEVVVDPMPRRYRFLRTVLVKPILKIFYRDITVVGEENLSQGRTPTLIAHNQSNMAMDPILMIALSSSLPPAPLSPWRFDFWLLSAFSLFDPFASFFPPVERCLFELFLLADLPLLPELSELEFSPPLLTFPKF